MQGVLEEGIRASLSALLLAATGVFLHVCQTTVPVLCRKKGDLCHCCKSYRPLELIEMYVLELETQPAAPSVVLSNSCKKVGVSLDHT